MMSGIINEVNPKEEQLSDVSMTEIPLPSKGLLYKNKQASVLIEPMRTKHERILASMNTSNSLEVMLQVMRDCIKFEDDFNEMLLGDALYLIIVLRAISLGGDVKYNLVCPECNHQFLESLKIPDEFSIIELTPEDIPPFYVELPDCKKVVGWRYLRVGDEKIIVQRVKKLHETMGTQMDLRNIIASVRQAQAIVSIDGRDVSENHFIMEKIKFVDDLTLRDLYILRDAIDNKDFGMNTTKSVWCPACGKENEFNLTLSPEFFRPKLDASRYIRTGVSTGNVRKDEVK